MAHELEINADGTARMAYAGDVPWHGLGKQVLPDLTPAQMLKEAGLNHKNIKTPLFAEVDGMKVDTGRQALVRDDGKFLDIVGPEWHDVDNEVAMEFFNEFVMEGDMQMHTAGSLQDGRIMWALAKVGEDFELFNGDRVESYLQFTNFHKFGYSNDVRFTPIRVVCNNTLSMSLQQNAKHQFKINHRSKFDAEQVKAALGIARNKLHTYKDIAAFLGSKRFTQETIEQYFADIFPSLSSKENKVLSRAANQALDVLYTQPGAEYAEGTWWQGFNAVTYLTDHKLGHSADSRLSSSWYGINQTRKVKALEKAIEYANAA